MELFSITGDEGLYRPPWLVRLFVVKEKMFSAKQWKVLNQFYGWADTQPSTPFAYDSTISFGQTYKWITIA